MGETYKNVLIIVTADPRVNGRAAEAVRIAAGVGGWEKVSVKLCLCGEARRVLVESPDDLVKGEIFEQYLPMLREGESRLRALVGGADLVLPEDVLQISVSELAAWGRETESVLRF